MVLGSQLPIPKASVLIKAKEDKIFDMDRQAFLCGFRGAIT